MFTRQPVIARSLQAAAIATMLFSAVTSFDALHHYVELFSHFRLQYLAASLLLLLFFTLPPRRPNFLIALAFTAALNAGHVLPWYQGETPADGPVSLKILHANVLSSNDQYERLLQLVDSERADVVFLQEVTENWQNATRPLAEDYPYAIFEARDDNFGIAMLSRKPLQSTAIISSPPLGYPTIVATLSANGEMLTLISTHAPNPLSRSTFDARNEHFRGVADVVGTAKGPVLLTGDFNTGMWGSNYRALVNKAGLKNASRGFGILPTWPTFLPPAMIPIDHAFVSKEIGVVDLRTGSPIGSDHLPLIIEIAIGDRSD